MDYRPGRRKARAADSSGQGLRSGTASIISPPFDGRRIPAIAPCWRQGTASAGPRRRL